MKISNRRKVLGIVFSAVILVLILSVLTPTLGIINKTIPITNSLGSKTIPITNTLGSGSGYGYGYGCAPHSPGYWKNHPESWPVAGITIGGTYYTKAQAISLMNTPTRGDKTYTMFEQLVAAKLNILMGCDPSCIDEVITDADAWMRIHPVGSGVKANSPAWTEGEPLKDMLEDYNQGYLCW